jgi:transcriptional regulator with XRE-family HTH domain
MERGPIGARFASNLRELRRARGWDQARLSEALTAIGHPIGVNSISRLEKGERRADVSDLVALAVALDCSPNRLFLSDAPGPDGEIALTAEHAVGWGRAWAWATGELPLNSRASSDDEYGHDLRDYVQDAQWRAVNRPHDDAGQLTVDEVINVDLGEVTAAIRAARDRGVPTAVIFSYLDLLRPMLLAVSEEPRDDDGR